MQAIRTRYHGPTNTRPSHISAKCEAGLINHTYDFSLDLDGNHQAAMCALRKKLKWHSDAYPKMWSGSFGHDCYWVFLPKFSEGV